MVDTMVAVVKVVTDNGDEVVEAKVAAGNAVYENHSDLTKMNRCNELGFELSINLNKKRTGPDLTLVSVTDSFEEERGTRIKYYVNLNFIKSIAKLDRFTKDLSNQ